MRLRLPPWVFFLTLAAAIAIALYSLNSYRHRFVRSDADLVRLLPSRNATRFFANFAVLRKTGTMWLLAGAKPAEEKDYAAFVEETRFDYTKDIDALAGAVDNDRIFFAARGRFDWDTLRNYVTAHGGFCKGDEFCSIQTSKPGRWASLKPIQPDVIALAVAPAPSQVQWLGRAEHGTDPPLPSAPVWLEVSQALLRNPVDLPLPLRIFAIALQSAERVIISVDSAEENSRAAFEIRLDATCPNAVTAATIRNQLDLQTKLLKLELAREHEQPNPADLSGLLTAGSFEVVNRHVMGTWPVRKELLKTLQ